MHIREARSEDVPLAENTMDPLVWLPTELVLRIVDFVDLASAAHLTQTSRAWHNFIDGPHQDHIYSSSSKLGLPPSTAWPPPHERSGADRFAFLGQKASFAKFFDGVTSWKELCRRELLLRRNWQGRAPEAAVGNLASSPLAPVARASTIQVGLSPVWRFKADWKRRFIVSTSQTGGLYVTDMDLGVILWQLPHTEVRPYAHLEYDMEKGVAVFDRMGNAVEVWKVVATDETDAPEAESKRGVFRHVAVLNHDCETRGYQLSYDTLCIVSSQGQGFVYDMTKEPPTLKTHVEMDDGAIGHLDQCEDCVLYSLGTNGYHVHDKKSGEFLGKIDPKLCENVYYLKHPPTEETDIFSMVGQRYDQPPWPPEDPRNDRLFPLKLHQGSNPEFEMVLPLEEDEWGAGMLCGDFMVGISKGGRVFIASNWRSLLGKTPDNKAYSTCTALIETEDDGSTFDLGGWLSIRDRRLLFEVNDRVYIFCVPDPADSPLPLTGASQLPIYATSQSSAPQLSVPVSFMAMWDDCLMFTFATLGVQRDENPEEDGGQAIRLRAFPTKAIRILSLAPSLGNLNY